MTPSSRYTPRALAFLERRQLGFMWAIAVIFGAAIISANPDVTLTRLIMPVVIMVAYGVLAFNKSAALFAGASGAFKSSIMVNSLTLCTSWVSSGPFGLLSTRLSSIRSTQVKRFFGSLVTLW